MRRSEENNDEGMILGERWDKYNGFSWDREEDYCDTYDGDATRDD